MGDQGLDQEPAVAAEPLAGVDVVGRDLVGRVVGRVAPPVGPVEPLGAGAEAGQPSAARPSGGDHARRWSRGRTGDGRRASRTPRSGPRRPSAAACPGRPRPAGWQARATASAGSRRGRTTTVPRSGWWPTGRARVGGYARSARRHEGGCRDQNLGKSGYPQIGSGGGRIGSPRRPCQTGCRRGPRAVGGTLRIRPGRTRGRRDGSRRTGPSAGGSVGIRTGRMISRTSPRRQNRNPLSAIQRRTWLGSRWNWNGPGLIAGRSVQSTGDSAATMSRRFTRQGVPSMARGSRRSATPRCP